MFKTIIHWFSSRFTARQKLSLAIIAGVSVISFSGLLIANYSGKITLFGDSANSGTVSGKVLDAVEETAIKDRATEIKILKPKSAPDLKYEIVGKNCREIKSGKTTVELPLSTIRGMCPWLQEYQTTKTASDGSFKFSFIPEGNYYIEVVRNNYQSFPGQAKVQPIKVKKTEVSDTTIYLAKTGSFFSTTISGGYPASEGRKSVKLQLRDIDVSKINQKHNFKIYLDGNEATGFYGNTFDFGNIPYSPLYNAYASIDDKVFPLFDTQPDSTLHIGEKNTQASTVSLIETHPKILELAPEGKYTDTPTTPSPTPTKTDAQKRDDQRKADLTKLKTALDTYSKTKGLPASDGWIATKDLPNSNDSLAETILVAKTIDKIPCDPTNTAKDCASGITYQYWRHDYKKGKATEATLYAKLESPTDADKATMNSGHTATNNLAKTYGMNYRVEVKTQKTSLLEKTTNVIASSSARAWQSLSLSSIKQYLANRNKTPAPDIKTVKAADDIPGSDTTGAVRFTITFDSESAKGMFHDNFDFICANYQNMVKDPRLSLQLQIKVYPLTPGEHSCIITPKSIDGKQVGEVFEDREDNAFMWTVSIVSGRTTEISISLSLLSQIDTNSPVHAKIVQFRDILNNDLGNLMPSVIVQDQQIKDYINNKIYLINQDNTKIAEYNINDENYLEPLVPPGKYKACVRKKNGVLACTTEISEIKGFSYRVNLRGIDLGNIQTEGKVKLVSWEPIGVNKNPALETELYEINNQLILLQSKFPLTNAPVYFILSEISDYYNAEADSSKNSIFLYEYFFNEFGSSSTEDVNTLIVINLVLAHEYGHLYQFAHFENDQNWKNFFEAFGRRIMDENDNVLISYSIGDQISNEIWEKFIVDLKREERLTANSAGHPVDDRFESFASNFAIFNGSDDSKPLYDKFLVNSETSKKGASIYYFYAFDFKFWKYVVGRQATGSWLSKMEDSYPCGDIFSGGRVWSVDEIIKGKFLDCSAVTVTGKVTDRQYRTEIPGVVVRFSLGGVNIGTTTKDTPSRGLYNLSNIVMGNYRVELTKEGYQPKTDQANVRAGANEFNFIMDKIATPATPTAQSAIKGFVTKSVNSTPNGGADGATVQVLDGSRSVGQLNVNLDGSYTINITDNPPKPTYTVKASYLSNSPQTKTASVQAGQTTSGINFNFNTSTTGTGGTGGTTPQPSQLNVYTQCVNSNINNPHMVSEFEIHISGQASPIKVNADHYQITPHPGNVNIQLKKIKGCPNPNSQGYNIEPAPLPANEKDSLTFKIQ